MKQVKIITYYQELFDSFMHYYGAVGGTPEMEDIHQMRVSIKKLRALWSLMEVLSGREWDKRPHFGAVAGLFKKAGRLREYQVIQGLLPSYRIPMQARYEAYLKQSEEAARKKLRKEIRRFDTKAFRALNGPLFLRMEALTERQILERSIRFIGGHHRTVRRLHEGLPDNRKLHKIRIELKSVHEVLSILCEIRQSPSLAGERKILKALNSSLGEWHDYCDFIDSLNGFLKGPPTKGKKDFMRRLRRQQRERRDVLCKKLDTYLRVETLNSRTALIH